MISSEVGPTTAMVLSFFASSGRMPVFLSSTIDSCAALRASASCSGDWFTLKGICAQRTFSGGSNMPSLKRVRNARRSDYVDLRFGDQSQVDGVEQRGIGAAAVHVIAALDAEGGGFLGRRHDLVKFPDVVDRITVRDHVALEAPLVAQHVGQQPVTARSGFAVEAVVGAHHRGHVAFLHQRPERG